MIYDLSNSRNCNDLECPWRSFPYCKPFQVQFFVFVVHRAVPLHPQSFFLIMTLFVRLCVISILSSIVTESLPSYWDKQQHLLTYICHGSHSWASSFPSLRNGVGGICFTDFMTWSSARKHTWFIKLEAKEVQCLATNVLPINEEVPTTTPWRKRLTDEGIDQAHI